MLGQMCTDRAEQSTGEASVTAGADDEEIDIGVAQGVAGVAVQDVTGDVDVLISGKRCDASEFVANETARSRVVIGVDQSSLDGDGGGLPGMDKGDGVTRAGVVDRPAYGGVGCDRTVDADGDPFWMMAGCVHWCSMWRRLSVAELTITDRLDKAIAAAAMIGFKRPTAAMGIAAAL